MSQAFDAKELGWLLNVWASGSKDVWTVGGTPDEGRVMRYDGVSWSRVELGHPVGLLNWVHGFSDDDITIVGQAGTVLHFDGETFTLQPTPTTQDLWGVWGSSPNDLWAVGGNGMQESDKLILHFDGSAWTEIELPPLQKSKVRAFFKVWGTAADNVYVVGARGVVLHFDGQAWTEQLVGASDDLIALWGTGPDRIMAVGGRGNGIAARYDGSSWRTETLAPMPGLNGVFMRNDQTAHVVGVKGTVARLDFETFSFDRYDYDTALDLHAVFADSGGRLTAVGGSLSSTKPPHEGIAVWRELASDE